MVIRMSEKEAAKCNWLPENAKDTSDMKASVEASEERIQKLKGSLERLERNTYEERKKIYIALGTELNQVYELLKGKRGDWGKWLKRMDIASKTQHVYRMIADEPYRFDAAKGDISKVRAKPKKKPDPHLDPGDGKNVSLTQNEPDPAPSPVGALSDLMDQFRELVEPLDLEALSDSDHKVLETELDWLATFCFNKISELHEGEVEEWTFDLSTLCGTNGALSPN